MNVLLSDATGGQSAMNIESFIQSIQPIGAIIAWYFELDKVPIPEGWALCNGQTVNGIKTPDLRGRSILMPPVGDGIGCGYSGSKADNSRVCIDLGMIRGEESHRLTIQEMPSHTHGYTGTTPAPFAQNADPRIIGQLQDKQTAPTGGNAPHYNVHPVVGVNYIMKISHPKINSPGIPLNVADIQPDSLGSMKLTVNSEGKLGVRVPNPVFAIDCFGPIESRGLQTDSNKGIRLTGRNQDGASLTNYNGGLESWWGIGFNCTLDSTTRHMFDTRTGKVTTTGTTNDVDVNHNKGAPNGASFFTCRYDNVQIGDVRQNTSSSVSFNTSSDYRLKENVINTDSVIDLVNKMRVVNFNYKNDEHECIGFIAHELKELLPNAAIVSGEKDETKIECKLNCKECKCNPVDVYQAVDYGKLSPICIKAIQELSDENKTLKSKIEMLEENQKKLTEQISKILNN